MMRWARRGTVLALALTAAGCGAGEAAPPLRIDGSVGVRPLVEVLAGEYRERNPAAVVELGEGLGSSERLRALAEGEIDIALASHGLVPEEIARQGMEIHEIARVAVVFGANSGVSVSGITESQVCDVFGGRVTNWRELGGPDLPIATFVRPPEEVDDEVVAEHLPCWSGLGRESVRVYPDPSELAAELAATPGGLGVTTMTLVEQSGGRILPLALDGVAPDAENVRSGAYELVREFFLVTMDPPPPHVAAFLDFIRSPEGEAVIRANGAVPTR